MTCRVSKSYASVYYFRALQLDSISKDYCVTIRRDSLHELPRIDFQMVGHCMCTTRSSLASFMMRKSHETYESSSVSSPWQLAPTTLYSAYKLRMNDSPRFCATAA